MDNTPQTFNEERAGAAMLLERELKQAMIELQEINANEKSETDAIKAFYKTEREKAQARIDEIYVKLESWVNKEAGEKSFKTSLGRFQTTTTKAGSWVVPKNKGFMSKVPDEYKIQKTVESIDTNKIKTDTTVTSDGKVIFKETGEVLEGVTGTPAGKTTTKFYPADSFKEGVKEWAKDKK